LSDRQARLQARKRAIDGNDTASTSWTARRAAALSPFDPEGLRREGRRPSEVQFLALGYKPRSPSEIACNAQQQTADTDRTDYEKAKDRVHGYPSNIAWI
jgi:hypothetical protein